MNCVLGFHARLDFRHQIHNADLAVRRSTDLSVLHQLHVMFTHLSCGEGTFSPLTRRKCWYHLLTKESGLLLRDIWASKMLTCFVPLTHEQWSTLK